MRNKINEKIMYTSYKRSNKWLGIIDYKSLCIILVYIWLVINILDLINLDFEKSLYVFLFLTVPIISIMLININNESTINVIICILKFIISKGIYVDKTYYKNNKDIYH